MKKPRYRRIMIFGCPGSGKSTYAHQLHQQTGLPCHHLDKIFFTANWAEQKTSLFLAQQQTLVQSSQWIIDGNCLDSLDMRWQKADLVLYFNFSRVRCLVGIAQRILLPNPLILDRAPGCVDGFNRKLLHYLWHFDQRVEPIIATLRQRYPKTPFTRIQSSRALSAVQTMIMA